MRELGRLAAPFVQENVLLDTPRNHPADFEKKTREYMREGSYWPVLLGTHKSHPAGFPLIEEAEYIARLCNPHLAADDQITGSLLLIANTMEEGQGEVIEKSLKQAQPIFDKYNVEMAQVLRGKDAAHLDAATKREYRNTLSYKLNKVIEDGQIPLILPEGTVQSGRQKEGGAPGEINGMVQLASDAVAAVAGRIRRKGREPLFFFVGTTGENRIYDPIAKQIPSEVYETAFKRISPIGKYFVPPIMSSVVDYPMSLRRIEELYGENGKLPRGALEQICGQFMARLLPPHERGVFADDDLDELEFTAGRRSMEGVFEE